MIRRSKEEINEEIAHLLKILANLRRRRRALEEKESQQGLNTAPEIINELALLQDRISKHEEEIAQLESLAVEGQLPISEVEYRVLLAETWDTPQGRPSVVGEARLELARLRLGLSLERAQQLEQEIRVALAKEALTNVDIDFFTQYLRGYGYDKRDAFSIIGRAIRLDVSTVTDWFQSLVPHDVRPNMLSLKEMLLSENGSLLYQKEYTFALEKFVDTLPDVLKRDSISRK